MAQRFLGHHVLFLEVAGHGKGHGKDSSMKGLYLLEESWRDLPGLLASVPFSDTFGIM